jgi:ornithine decarboxylase
LNATTAPIRSFIDANPELDTPYLVVDLDVVADRFGALAAALDGVALHYAVKANPAADVLRVVLQLGGNFDVASPAEIDMCLAAGARPSQISYGNTAKKLRDIAYAHEMGVRLYSFDSRAELSKLTAAAPGSTVMCRVLCGGAGADWPLSRKFGCEPEMAVELLTLAAAHGHGTGLAFHVGSQQRHPEAFDTALREIGWIVSTLSARGVRLDVLNLGGGFPAHYHEAIPEPGAYASAIRAALAEHLPEADPTLIAEPGRYLVGDAGVIVSEVVLVSTKSAFEDRRWVTVDIGLFGGLAEALDEAIRYRITTPHDDGPAGPVVIAGPSCDSMDVLYDKSDYELPLALSPGDRVLLHATGAYTTTYASVGFNGFPPLRAHMVSGAGRVAASR